MTYSNMLAALATAPATQIDPIICTRLNELSKKKDPQSDEMLDIIDDCVFSSLASPFAMNALNEVWKRMITSEGITMADALMAAEPRRTAKEQLRVL
jgi:hypothetical protein